MQFEINVSVFNAALSKATNIVDRRAIIPILNNILLVADKGQLTIKSTDLDCEAHVVVDCTSITDGAITAPAHLLHDIIGRAPEGADVNFRVDEKGRIYLKIGKNGKYNMASLPAAEFPNLDQANYTSSVSLPASQLCDLFDFTAHAMSVDEARFYLNGVNLMIEPKGLAAVATDGFQLAHCIAEFAHEQSATSAILPRPAVMEMRRLLRIFKNEPATVSFAEAKIKFTFGDVTYISKIIDGTYPDWERVVPKGNQIQVTANAQGFSRAAARVALLNMEKLRPIRLEVSKNQVNIKAVGEDAIGDEVFEVAFDDEPFAVGYNYKTFSEILSKIEGDAVFAFNSNREAPAFITQVGNDKFYFVLMPLRT